MTEKYQTLDLEIDFRSTKIEQAIAEIWNSFFDRVTELDYSVDRAIWICNRFPAWVGVKPGSENDDDYDEPAFVVSALVGKIDSIRDEVRGKGLPESDCRKQ